MQIIITKVINRLALIKYIYIIEQCGLKEAKRKADAISDGIEQSIDIPDKYLTQFKTACEFTIESKRYNMEKYQFKPFDQVLVRNTEGQTWKPNFYSFEGYDDSGHVCTNDMKYMQCIPYNENTAHLVGTNESYKEPEPKEWQIMGTGYNDLLTAEELINFIQGAVINNKDITDFRIRYTGQ